ncbi:YeeE/YedE family protein [Pseudomonas sp. NPDC087612]|uniref:YeeE/YedE family protein n=1 Tax=unclassified Pseudomonas TaxID=196821 RepID=UPI00215DD59A|nr:YeeE/YedE thiosulfate transporter family protein [Pseudomonas sp. B21-032]UVL64207.1 YeeE/YedE family protein [Pseudomonas sp. B21-032]
MTIDWVNFTPWSALLGGALIGLAVSLFALVNGRIAGISGLLGSLLQKKGEGRGEKALFLLGVLVAPLVWRLFAGRPVVQFQTDWVGLLVAGLLVGLGTRYAAGCTSGHGVCGLARLSPRSLVATLCFMCAGFAVVFVSRHLAGV